MSGDATRNDGDHAHAFLHAEYTALRDEMVRRVELRQRLVEITLASLDVPRRSEAPHVRKLIRVV